ncbi:MAG: PEGA domain-containing protein [Acidobacteriota bacterium]
MSRRPLAAVLRLAASACVLGAVVVAFWLPMDGSPTRSVLDRALDAVSPRGAAPGFMLRMTSTPSGAVVGVDGQRVGTTPYLGNVVCRQGERVTIEASAPEHRTWRREIECREGASLDAAPRLEPLVGP